MYKQTKDYCYIYNLTLLSWFAAKHFALLLTITICSNCTCWIIHINAVHVRIIKLFDKDGGFR